MSWGQSLAAVMILSFVALSCSNPPASPTSASAGSGDLEITVDGIPSWVTDPSEVPAGLRGKNNCTFPFGNATAMWNFHSEGACWERSGPAGWTRQQQHRVHASSVAACGGGAGDVSPIRVCRSGGQGQPTPFCLVNRQTGPNGCAVCITSVVCH